MQILIFRREVVLAYGISFSIGVILAIFFLPENVSFRLNFYIATVSDVAIFDAMGSINFIEILSSSAKQSLFVVFYSFSVSSMLIL